MTAQQISLSLGALSEPLSQQVSAQGAVLLNAEFWDADADAVVRLGVRGILTDREYERARSRLIDKVIKDVRLTASQTQPQA